MCDNVNLRDWVVYVVCVWREPHNYAGYAVSKFIIYNSLMVLRCQPVGGVGAGWDGLCCGDGGCQ